WRDGQSRTVHALAVSPCGKWLVATKEYGGVVAWPLPAGGDPVAFTDNHNDHTSSQPVLAIRADSKFVATPWHNWREQAYGFMLWNLARGSSAKRIKAERQVNAIAFTPDGGGGGLIAVASDKVVLWDYDQPAVVRTFQPPLQPQEIAFRPDGNVLATAGGHSVFAFDVQSGQLLRTLKGSGAVTGLAYSPDGKYLAAIGRDGVVTLRDAGRRETGGDRFLDIGRLWSLAWRRDSAALFVGGDKTIAACGLDDLLVKGGAKRKPKGEPLSLAGHERRVVGLAYSPDGRTLLSYE